MIVISTRSILKWIGIGILAAAAALTLASIVALFLDFGLADWARNVGLGMAVVSAALVATALAIENSCMFEDLWCHPIVRVVSGVAIGFTVLWAGVTLRTIIAIPNANAEGFWFGMLLYGVFAQVVVAIVTLVGLMFGIQWLVKKDPTLRIDHKPPLLPRAKTVKR